MANLFKQSSEGSIFRNEKYLYPEFVPESLPHRSAEIDNLVYSFNPVLRGGKPHNVFVYGPPGTGKTVCVKHVLNQLEEYSDRAKTIYINCFEFNTRYAVLSNIANFLGFAVPRRGSAVDEVYSRMLEALKKIDFTPIVILDEVDQLVNKAETSKLLYDLLRVIEHKARRVGIVVISNESSFVVKLDDRVRSSLGEEAVIFLPYSPQQLKDILKERAEQAFVPDSLGKEVINVAAAHGAKKGGDARIALECLWKAGREAEREGASKVELAHLNKVFGKIGSGSAVKAIKHLNGIEKELLNIIIQKEKIRSGELYSEFEQKTGKKLTPRRLSDMASKLEKKNLVVGTVISLGNQGKTREFALNVPKNLLIDEMKKN